MAKDRKVKKKKKSGMFDVNKAGMLADLEVLKDAGVKVTDCGLMGLLIENFQEGVSEERMYIIDRGGSLHKSKRVFPQKRGYQLCSSNGKEHYLRPIPEPQ